MSSQGEVGSPAEWLKNLSVSSIATILFRASQAIGGRLAVLGYIVKQVNHMITGADLAWQAEVGSGLRLFHPTGVVWGPDVKIGRDCWIQQGVTIGYSDESHGSPIIGNQVHIGAGARVIGDVHISDNVTIGANAVVTRDVDAGSTVAGVPARVIRRYRPNSK